MINPEMNDWWSHRRLTNLKYDERSLNGAGVSMQVLAHAFAGNEFFWFSKIFSEFNDNLISIAIDRKTAQSFSLQKYDDLNASRAFFGKIWNNEYKLTNEIEEMVGLSINQESFSISNKNKFQFSIYSHDNCFFHIEPVIDETLTTIIHAILQQHSFYLGQDVNWETVEPKMICLLKEHGEIDLQSDLNRKCVWIPKIEPRVSWLRKKFRKGSITIDNKNAVFTEKEILVN